jgi:hypothetical protein
MGTSPKPFVFVLMPFDRSFDDLFRLGIKAACEAAGAYCERLDDQIFQENMLDRIYNEIAKADIVVAEMTGRNANVFYEVGYAHALGKRVVPMTKAIDDIPFDLQHYSHIVHGNRIGDVRETLERHIRWYLSHPADHTPDALAEMQIYLDGQPLSSEHAIQVQRRALVTHRSRDGGPFVLTRTYLRFDFTAHNVSTTHFQTLRFSPQLITTNHYADFADANAPEIKPTPAARLPNEKAAHRFPSPVVVEPGGSTAFSFALFPGHDEHDASEDSAELRLLGDHPPIDRPFRFVAPKKERH